MSWLIPDAFRARVDAVPRPDFGGLPPRLAAIALAVPSGARVLDIGADHGLLGAALVADTRAGGPRAAHVTAVDVSPDALAGARRTLAAAVAEGRAEVLLGDGFAAVEPDSHDCAVLAGMGARNTLEILARGFAGGHRPRRVLVQALAGEHRVRTALTAAGYGLVEEHLTADGKRLFLTLVLERGAGHMELLDDVDLYVGPRLRTQRGLLLDAWLATQAAWLREKVRSLSARDDEHAASARRRLAAIESAAGPGGPAGASGPSAVV